MTEPKPSISRRDFLKVASTSSLAFWLSGCGPSIATATVEALKNSGAPITIKKYPASSIESDTSSQIETRYGGKPVDKYDFLAVAIESPGQFELVDKDKSAKTVDFNIINLDNGKSVGLFYDETGKGFTSDISSSIRVVSQGNINTVIRYYYADGKEFIAMDYGEVSLDPNNPPSNDDLKKLIDAQIAKGEINFVQLKNPSIQNGPNSIAWSIKDQKQDTKSYFSDLAPSIGVLSSIAFSEKPVPMIEVDGIKVPDPKVTNPELFDITKPDSPISKFVESMKQAGIDINPQQIIDASGDINNLKVFTGVDGKKYVNFIFKTTQDGVDYATGFIFNPDKGWLEATTGNLAKIKGLLIGSNVRLGDDITFGDLTNRRIATAVGKEFNFSTIDEHFKFRRIEPSQNSFNFKGAEEEVGFAIDAGLIPMAHGLLYGNRDPNQGWLEGKNFTPEEMKVIVTNHVGKIVTHFKGRVPYWLVVNEVGNRDGFLTADSNYPQEAFAAAEQADPSAMLIYNFDTDNVSGFNGVDRQYLKTFKQVQAGHLILGLEGHLMWSQIGTEESMIKTLQEYGVPISITELDINMKGFNGTPEEKQRKQAELFQRTLRAIIKSGVCSVINFWETGDKYSWLEDTEQTGSRFSSEADPTLFDDNIKPKPSLFAVRAALLDQAA